MAKRTWWCAVGLLLLFGRPAPAAQMMNVSEVRAGMLAVGKSVFHGTTIERFHLRILGVEKKMNAGRDVILAQVLDGPVIAQQTGILAGMSGSPIYVNGRLIGALAFGWSFSKAPICGITPIGDMLSAWQPGRGWVAPPPPSRLKVNIPGRGKGELRPVGGVLLASGLPDQGIAQLSKLLAPYGVKVMAGPGTGSQAPMGPLQPGAAMGAQLVSGDIDLTALGTLTYREGDRILAFGHPFLGIGGVDLPMTTGYIHTLMPSYEMSAKFGSAGPRVGRIFADANWSIGGRIGEQAKTMGMTLEISDSMGPGRRVYRAQVIRHHDLIGPLAGVVALSLLQTHRGHAGEATLRLSVDIRARGLAPIHRQDLLYGGNDLPFAVFQRVAVPLQRFANSEFGKMDLESLTVKLEAVTQRKTATIERVSTSQEKAKAGKPLELQVGLRPFGGEVVTRTIKLDLPADLPSGSLRVMVTGGEDAEQAKASMGAPQPRPTSLQQLIRLYQAMEPSQKLVAVVGLPRAGVAVSGQLLASLPPSMLEVMRAAHTSELNFQRDALWTGVETDWVLSGRQSITIPLEGKPGAAPARILPVEKGEEAGPRPPGPTSQESGPEEGDQGGDEGDDGLWSEAAAPPAAPQLPPGHPPVTKAGRPQVTTESAAEAPAKEEEEAPPTKAKQDRPLARQPRYWVHHQPSDFGEGTFSGAALSSRGQLSMSSQEKVLHRFQDPYAWSLLKVGDRLYLGAGNSGTVYRVSLDGQAEPVMRSSELEVLSLAADPAGNIYAGTAPHGEIYRISPDGKTSLLYRTGQSYVWALVMDGHGSLLAAAGAPAAVYRVSTAGALQARYRLPATHVLSLSLDGQGGFYAGTASAGMIYRVPASGQAVPFFATSATSVPSLAVDGKGTLYAGTYPQGMVYAISSQGEGQDYYDSPQRGIYALTVGPDGALYAGSGPDGLIYRITGRQEATLLFKPEEGQTLALVVDQAGTVYAAGSNPGLIRTLGPGTVRSASYESPVLDAGSLAHWGRVSWDARLPKGSQIAVRTRSGQALDKHDGWSDWSAPHQQGQLVTSPHARFLQYRVELISQDGSASPVLEQIRLAYLPQNDPPDLKLLAPAGGERWSKSQRVRWQGRDDDKDTLAYTLSVSPDGGQSWQDLATNLRDASYQWDTSKAKDGEYLIRVRASDQPSNPVGALSTEQSAAVMVDNTAPSLSWTKEALQVAADRTVSLKGWAADSGSGVAGVDWQVDGGPWQAAAADPDLIGAAQTGFSFASSPLAVGKHNLQARVFDQAGNMGSTQVEVEVKGPAAEAKPPAAEAKPAPAGQPQAPAAK